MEISSRGTAFGKKEKSECFEYLFKFLNDDGVSNLFNTMKILVTEAANNFESESEETSFTRKQIALIIRCMGSIKFSLWRRGEIAKN